MDLRRRSIAVTPILALAILALVPRADAQASRAGIVATLIGDASVARASLARPAALRFRDDVYTQDRITTQEEAFVRLLLGGKAIVTIRERSSVTITERPGASTISVRLGRVAVSVVKSRMLPGEVVEVTTPNAISGIRGTVIVAEVEPDLAGVRSTITVLTGLIDVARFDGSGPVGPVTAVGALQRVVVRGSGPVGAPTAVSPDAARRLGNEFTVKPSQSPHAAAPASPAVVESAVREGTSLAALGLEAGGAIRIGGSLSGATTSDTTATAVSSGGNLTSGVSGAGTLSGVSGGTLSGVSGAGTLSGVSGGTLSGVSGGTLLPGVGLPRLP